MSSTVNIRPGVSVLGVFRHLHYKPWYALAEFVDNSLGSYLANRAALARAEGPDFALRVSISIDPHAGEIRVRDNAAGISVNDFPRAFRPAAVPPDRSGLSEFGMGMKSAACWFAPVWSVRTSALGEPITRTVRFDIAEIVHDDIEDVVIEESPERAEAHYTELVLENVHHMPVGRSLGKLKDHLTDIYRAFTRADSMILELNGVRLEYQEPPVLVASSYNAESEEPVLWRKDICVDLGEGKLAWGFAALRAEASTSRAGFALFRRGRVIQGSGDEGYRPEHVFGKANSYRYQRLFGELNLEGFEVSHTKDGFQWDDSEQQFLEALRLQLDSEPLPLLKQAEKYRARVARRTLEESAAEALSNTASVIQARLPAVLLGLADAPTVGTPAIGADEAAGVLAEHNLELDFRGQAWRVAIRISDDPSEGRWLNVGETAGGGRTPRTLDIQLSAVHPFMIRFAQMDPEQIESLLRVGAAIALGEVLARESGVEFAGTVRRNVNELLTTCLSDA